MITDGVIKNRFQELMSKMDQIKVSRDYEVDSKDWSEWSNAVLNLLKISFGDNSDYYKNFNDKYHKFSYYNSDLNNAKGIFISAKNDYDSGFYFSLEKQISGEIFGDFVALAKTALSDNYKDVAAVLACAALEDALKKYAFINGIDVNDKSMTDVISNLKSKGLVKGAQKTLLDTMPKLRNYAMHANWDKFAPEDVSSIIGFVEQFLLSNF